MIEPMTPEWTEFFRLLGEYVDRRIEAHRRWTAVEAEAELRKRFPWLLTPEMLNLPAARWPIQIERWPVALPPCGEWQ